MKKQGVDNIIIFILLIGMFLINPILSIIINVFICYYISSKLTFKLLIINLSIINMFKIPHSDYYRYYNYYYYLKELGVSDFMNSLSGNPDYLFYIQKYIFARNGLHFSTWAFFYSLLSYILIYFMSKNIKPRKYILGLILFINPFNITRFVLATIISVFIFFKLEKKFFPYFISTTLHKVMLIFYGVEFLKRVKISKKLYLILVILILLGLFFAKKYVFEFLNLSEKYMQTSFNITSEFSFQKLRTQISFVINLLIITLYIRVQNKTVNVENYLYKNIIFTLIPIYFISATIFGRLLYILVYMILYSFMRLPNKYNLKKKIVLLLLLFQQFIVYSDEIRYGYKTESYPFKYNRVERLKLQLFLDENGHIKKN